VRGCGANMKSRSCPDVEMLGTSCRRPIEPTTPRPKRFKNDDAVEPGGRQERLAARTLYRRVCGRRRLGHPKHQKGWAARRASPNLSAFRLSDAVAPSDPTAGERRRRAEPRGPLWSLGALGEISGCRSLPIIGPGLSRQPWSGGKAALVRTKARRHAKSPVPGPRLHTGAIRTSRPAISCRQVRSEAAAPCA